MNLILPSLSSQFSGYVDIFSINQNQLKKVGTVTLAALSLFTLQIPLSMAMTAKIAASCCALTFISEKTLRAPQEKSSWNHTWKAIWQGHSSSQKIHSTQNWFSVENLNSTKLMKMAQNHGKALALPWILNFIIMMVFKIALLPSIPFSLRLATISVINAPICEEILFRGFLQERLEDLCFLANRYITPISTSTQLLISSLVQSTLFGIAHIHSYTDWTQKAIATTTITVLGTLFTRKKIKKASLLPSIALHSIHNGYIMTGFAISRILS